MKSYTYTLLSAFLLTHCQPKEEYKSIPAERFCLNEKTTSIIEISPVEKQSAVKRIHLTGEIESNPDQVLPFVSLVEGVISASYFSLGDRVTKGQVLAEMHSIELATLQTQLNTLQSQIEVAALDLRAKEQLYEDGILSTKDWKEAQHQQQILIAEKHQIERSLSLFSPSPTKDAFLIRAPISGIITSKRINAGTSVTGGGEPLFTISNLKTLWAMANIYATDISDITNGMEVEIRTVSYPDDVFTGKLDMISHTLDENAKVLKGRIVLENDHLRLKPGMIADITAFKPVDEQKIVIPTSSLIFFNGKNYVLRYGDDCNIEAREVNVLSQTHDLSYIEDGLEENDQIITKNHLLIFEAIHN